MSRALSLKTRIALQFLLILSPVAAVLIYQTAVDIFRTKQLELHHQLRVISFDALTQYKIFLDGVVDAVDSGRLSERARHALAQSRRQLELLNKRRRGAGAAIDYAHQLDSLLSAIESAPTLATLTPLRATINELGVRLGDGEKSYRNAEQAALERALQSARTQRVVVPAAILLSLALCIYFISIMIRGLTRPLAVAEQLANEIAQGHIAPAQNSYQAGDLGRLLQSLETMNSSLFNIVLSVKRAAGALETSVDKLASGTGDLARRTEQQAAALEETAASMTKLGGAVKLNAETAQQANALAKGASDTARLAADVTREVVSNMQSIDSGARKVADIIGVVDSIAFQTNILALNAAVEAARAGESGRGFAVVASEVRNLANRSAAAAKEIRTLIDASVNQVSAGNALVNKAGNTMQGVVTQITSVADLMGAISSASIDQSRGINEVQRALAQMDQVTHQNAQLVADTSEASASLAQQAKALSAAVSAFKLPDGHGAVTPTAPEGGAGEPKRRAVELAVAPRPTVNRLSHSTDDQWQEF